MDFNAWHRHPVFSQVRLLSVATAFLLAACLDIPDTPEPQNTASYVTVYAVQKGNADSTSLKIHPEDPATLKAVVQNVYRVLRKTEKYMAIRYDYIEEILPHDIFFITTSELEALYPDKTPKEREYLICREKGAVCLMQIGDKLLGGEPHDGRAPDYDDWKLNADILVYYPVLDIALELSSMGIRVDADALREQLAKAGCPERAELPFQKAILEERLPFTIGGGIGQSRICMFFLRKAHIGEVHSSIWPEDVIAACEKAGIALL